MVMTSFKGPHWDYMVPEPYDKMYDPKSIEKWGNFDDPFIDKPEIQQKEILRWNAGHLTWKDWQGHRPLWQSARHARHRLEPKSNR